MAIPVSTLSLDSLQGKGREGRFLCSSCNDTVYASATSSFFSVFHNWRRHIRCFSPSFLSLLLRLSCCRCCLARLFFTRVLGGASGCCERGGPAGRRSLFVFICIFKVCVFARTEARVWCTLPVTEVRVWTRMGVARLFGSMLETGGINSS